MIGKTIAHYKILEKLGEGGMGVVYKAEDTKLKRTVALKFLSAQALGTEDEKARFVREAQAAASLNHPNICTIYEIQEVDDQLFISMEYIEGETLHDRIKQGPLKIKEALKLATMAAEGLQAAHEKDIVHRDIKTSNIMLTKKGVAKIMDFGLAKVSAVSVLTQAGSTLGTIAYMSPEQAKGEPVDQRSDIFSLGIVLYEMVAGQVPFKGEYEQAMMYSILNVDPEPLTAVRTGVPIALDSIVAKLLAKDPDDRYQHVDELPVDLKAVDVKGGSTTALSAISTAQGVRQSMPKRRVIPLGIVILLMVGVSIVVGSTAWLLRPTPMESVKRLTVSLSQSLSSGYLFKYAPFALSPDGRNLVYSANEEGEYRLFLRSLEKYQATPLPGTEGGYHPFFSPDGKWVGFHTDSEIKKVALAGGNAQTITANREYFETGIWGPDDTILIGRRKSGLYRVSATGGSPEALAIPDGESGEIWELPAVLPGTKTIFFTIHDAQEDGSILHSIAALDLETGTRKLLVENGSNPRYASSGHLFFVQGEQVMVAPFDKQRVELTGTPVPVAENIHIYGDPNMFGAFSISGDGTLVFLKSYGIEEQRMPQLVWVDRNGVVTPITEKRGDFRRPSLSTDGNSIVLMIREEGIHTIYMYDMDRDRFNRFTFEGDNRLPIWTPDGRQVIFNSKRDGVLNLYWKSADGSGSAEQLLESEFYQWPSNVSPDGLQLAFAETHPESKLDIWILDLNKRTATLFLETPADEKGPMISPDGNWITYTSDESGQDEVYLRPFPVAGDAVYQISDGGGVMPKWATNGQELFYWSNDRMMVVEVETDPSFRPGAPRLLFEGLNQYDVRTRGYDVHPGGDRFLMVQEGEGFAQNQINIILNFDEELKRLVPTGN
jgi:eukaryotic-like serine/threonine-protein kinase